MNNCDYELLTIENQKIYNSNGDAPREIIYLQEVLEDMLRAGYHMIGMVGSNAHPNIHTFIFKLPNLNNS